ncbi:MAG: hypothetical protein J07HQX50_01497, partial [Haloquadratum sp. J07HQX50]
MTNFATVPAADFGEADVLLSPNGTGEGY